MACNAVSRLQPVAEATKRGTLRDPALPCRPAPGSERVETLLSCGMRLVVEGCCLTGDDPRARVHRLRIMAGDRTLYES